MAIFRQTTGFLVVGVTILVASSVAGDVIKQGSELTEATAIVKDLSEDPSPAVITEVLGVNELQGTKVPTAEATRNGTSKVKVRNIETLSTLFKCDGAVIEDDSFVTPTWLRQYMTSKLEPVKMQKYGDGLFKFRLAEDQFQCGNPLEFTFNKSQIVSQFKVLQAAKKSAHSVNRRMKGFMMPNGYLKHSASDQVNLYYPPSSYCISKVADDMVEGFLCPFGDALNPAPKIRKCTAMGFVMKYDPLKNPAKIDDILEVDEGWSPFFDLGSDSSSPSVSASQRPLVNPIYWQERIYCDPAKYVSEPRVAAAGHHKAWYKAIKVMEDGSILTRAKAHVPWSLASEDLVASVYCIDGYAFPPDSASNVNVVTAPSYLPRHDRQLILSCSPPPEEFRNSYKRGYGYILLVSTILLAAVVIIYGYVRPKENVHGRTSAAFVFCMFVYFVCLAIGNARSLQFGSVGCAVNGVVQHYFHLAMFFWIAVMNFDAWYILKNSKLAESEANKRFAIHCAVALVGPAIIVAIALCIGSAYPLNQDRVILPLYGYESCALNNDSQLYYFLIPTFFVFVTGLAFGLMAIKTLKKLRKEAKRMRRSSIKVAEEQWHEVYLRTVAIDRVSSMKR